MNNHIFHLSAGAVVSDVSCDKVLLLYRKNTDTYHLPKGSVEVGEELRETVSREVYEETGAQIRLGEYLVSVDSSFLRNGVDVRKKTLYFSAVMTGDVFDVTDGEHDRVDCVSYERACELLESQGGMSLGYEDELSVLHFWGSHIRAALLV